MQKHYPSFRSVFFLTVLCALAAGCNQGDERLAEKARIEATEAARAEMAEQLAAKDQLIEKARAEGRAAAQAEADVNNQNIAEKARLMEADLSARHAFYQAVRGTYEGTLATSRGEFKIRVTLFPNIPHYTGTRSRQLEEIASDLNQLSFNAQIVQWNPANNLSGVGCRIEGVRPDIENGQVLIASTGCPNFYSIQLGDSETAQDVSGRTGVEARGPDVAREVARRIRAGKVTDIKELHGEVHPTTNSTIYPFTVRRAPR